MDPPPRIRHVYGLCAAILGLALFGTSLAVAASGDELRIQRITPDGEDVPPGRQLVFQFDRPVVPIGRMSRRTDEIPVEITPPLACQWRWLDRSNLACQLDGEHPMTEATAYSVVLRPGLKAGDGSTLAADYRHRFITRRPSVTWVRFRDWQAPGHPVTQVVFNQPVSVDSVRAHLFFTINDGDRSRRVGVEATADPYDAELPRYVPLPGEPHVVIDFGQTQTVRPDDQPTQVQGVEARRVWLVSPAEELPPGANVSLRIEPGLVSALGPEPGITEREVVNFDTFPAFAFLGVHCWDNTDNRLLVTSREQAETDRCNPLRGIALAFSAPVLDSQIRDHVEVIPDLAGGRKDYDPWAGSHDYSRLHRPHERGRSYEVYLPEHLKAAHEYRVRSRPPSDSPDTEIPLPVDRPSDLRDEFGRTLPEPIDLSFLTDHRRPNYELVHRTAVLEEQVDTEVPLYVTNLERVDLRYLRLTPEVASAGLSHRLDVPEVEDIAFALPMGTREMLGDADSGAVYGRIASRPHVVKSDREKTFFAQVSPWQVHVKLGHYNTTVWITDLETGEVVPEAQVNIYKDKLTSLSAAPSTLDTSATGDDGVAVLKGASDLDPELETFHWSCHEDDCPRLFVRIDHGGQMAVMPLFRRFSVSTYRSSGHTVYADNRKLHGHIRTWGTTAQGVYRAGDTLQYKFYVRNDDNQRLAPAPRADYRLEIIDPTGKAVHEVNDIELSDFGAYAGDFRIPKTAAVGWYRFKLSASFTEYSWQPMRVLVSDFTPSPFRVKTELNGDLFHPGGKVEVWSATRLHSGGAYTDAQARVTATLRERGFSSKHPRANGFRFDSHTGQGRRQLFQQLAPLDDKGELTSAFELDGGGIIHGRMSVETAVQDDRGKYIASQSSAAFLAVDRLVGLKTTRWLYDEDQPAEVRYLVVDARGNPVAGTEVGIAIERLETKAARVKGAGNAYLTHFVDSWVPAGECAGESSDEPLTCRFIPEQPGSYRLKAGIQDSQGRPHATTISLWVAGKGRVVWRQPDDHSLQILPEQAEYRIGDTARYLIKNPYPGARALVSLERFGSIRHWVQTLEGSTPVIEFPVEADLMPGFYLSVLVTSPRVEAPPPLRGQVDLGKPAFKLGYVKVPVKDPHKEILVGVESDREQYRPRETVTARIQARPRHADRDEPIELAVAVLDEAVFDLIAGGRGYFDPYWGFYDLAALDMRNYNLLTRLLGRQKFEKKGANPGGDGGADLSLRNLFKFVSYWNPALETDAEGRAEIEFPVPDNLTGWRILALAVTPSDRMGLGEATFKVNRPTEIRPVMPNQVTEGDRFEAGFSVMNRSGRERQIRVEIRAEGDLEPARHTETVRLGPYKRTTESLPIVTRPVDPRRDVPAGELRFTATAGDKADRDGLEHRLPVNKRRSLETAANYGSTVEDRVTETLLFPENIHSDVGEVSVTLAPSVIGNVEGAFRYMRDYPYSCWEQKLSKGTMAAHFLNLRAYLADDLQWPEATGLPAEILEQAANFQAPNGGMVYYVPRDRYVSPYLSAYTGLAFNWLRGSGHVIPAKVEEKLHGYLDKLLRKDVLPGFYSHGMASTVRAVALAALAPHGKLGLAELQRYRPQVPFMSLFGMSHYLQAALAIEGTDEIVAEVRKRILAHASQSGGKFGFNEQLDDGYTRILSTPLRSNCAILSTFTKGEQSEVADIPFRLVRAITQGRGNREHWENTQENMFCMNALVDYSRGYEAVTPHMQVSAALDDEPLGKTRFDDLRDPLVTLSRPIQPGDPGRQAEMRIERSGDGRLYHATRMRYAPLADYAERSNAGIDIRREYSLERDGEWVLKKDPSEIQRGDLVRVDLYLSLPTARNFVVVDDPVPGGLEPVNRDLATSSSVDADKGNYQASGGSWWFQFSDWRHYSVSRWSFYHQEIRHDRVRFYSDYLPPGNYHLAYTAQAIAPGEFSIMPVHAEEMYDPDVFGKGLPGGLKVAD